MHIADGVIPLEIAVVTSVVSIGFLYNAIKTLQSEQIPLAAAMSALFFVSSFIHIPLGPTQIHLVLIGLIGVFLGRAAFLSIVIALILQAILLGFGGLTSLGANALIMGLPALLVSYIYSKDFFQKFNEKIRYFLVGFLGVFFASLFMGSTLFLSGSEYFYTALTSVGINTPAMILEGIITLFLIRFIKKTVPSLGKF